MKCMLLYMDTENTIRLIRSKIIDGKVKFKGKSFDVNKTIPYLYNHKKLFSNKMVPIYIVKYDSAVPYKFDFDDKKAKQTVTPENYSKLMEQGALRELLNVKGAEMKEYLMWILIGAVMGGLIGYIIAGAVSI